MIAGLLALPLAACAPARRALIESVEGPADQGRDLYQRLCASCHGTAGRGDGPLAGELRVPPPDLSRLAARNGGVFPATEVRAALTGERPIGSHGPVAMPVWGRQLVPDDSPAGVAIELDQARTLTAVIAYVEALQRAD
jgi:mono/diheme cytochrome c family protein